MAAALDCPMNTPAPANTTLHDAGRALWLATLSLMTAFMQTQAPAHRCLMARRIARNFETLREQECFSQDCRRQFARLGARWHAQADRLQGKPAPSRVQRVLGLIGLG
ncbi:hypothetical protein EZ313_14705 [Ramlibacter henchirensis]|uniref:Uncharacterized protein n=1 Tax=Ramlibacter henchirensis TaxID=204072 RepID=A0A4Z0BWZ7_9BURK|nr:hypothetical protein [Ramlibacter henchirensis]TFZ02509.1 hypothetical protein EZ313_14705 [Ramlibacter henchirensis]